MTFVDDSLAGTGAMRSAKTGSKSVGYAAIGGGAKDAAFENAIADAGKKKQTAVSLTAGNQTAVDVSLTADGKPAKLAGLAATDSLLPGTDVETADPGVVGKADAAALPNPTVSTKDTAGSDTALGAKHPSAEIVSNEIKVADGRPGKPADDAGSLPSLEKILELVKDGKLVAVRPGEAQKNGTADNRAALKDAEDPADATTGDTGDVSQLLALLGAPMESAAAKAADVPANSTTMISEFQALADRAGKTRGDNRLGNNAGTTRQAVLAADGTATANATGNDQIFRFARADGKGQPVSMRLNADGDRASAQIDAASAKADAASGAKAETVTVLESRRYLGLAANTNSQAVATAITGSTEWARAMQPSSGLSSPEAASAAGKVVNTLKIQMHPIDLGTVTATLRLKDDELHVDLKVETGEAFRQLSGDQNDMVKALRAQGFAVDQINITFNASSDSASGNAGSQQQQAQAGQQGRDASGDGAAQGRGRNENDSQQQAGERWTGNEGTDEAAAAERGLADHTYM